MKIHEKDETVIIKENVFTNIEDTLKKLSVVMSENIKLKAEIKELKNIHKAAESIARVSALSGVNARELLDTLFYFGNK